MENHKKCVDPPTPGGDVIIESPLTEPRQSCFERNIFVQCLKQFWSNKTLYFILPKRLKLQ